MRRNWIAVLLFAWALGLRALLPATAGVVHMDSGAKAVAICLPGQLPGASAQTPGESKPGESVPHREDCLWCAMSCDGVALPSTPTQTVAIFTPWQEAPWAQKRAAWSLVRFTTAHQPRAPPSFF